MAAAPTDPRKVKQEERPEKEARKEKRSEKEVRKRRPAVAATSQTQTVIDGTARRGRPGMDAQRKDLDSSNDSSSSSTSDTCSSDPYNRRRDFRSPSRPNSPYHFWSDYETPIEFRRRVGRRSGGHGKDGKRQRVVLKGKERAAPRTEGSADMISSGGDGKAGHRSHRKGGKDNSRSRGREPLSRRPLALPLRRPLAVPTHLPAAANHEAEVAAMQGASIPHPLPIFLNGRPRQVAVATLQGGTPGHPPSMSPWRTMC